MTCCSGGCWGGCGGFNRFPLQQRVILGRKRSRRRDRRRRRRDRHCAIGVDQGCRINPYTPRVNNFFGNGPFGVQVGLGFGCC